MEGKNTLANQKGPLASGRTIRSCEGDDKQDSCESRRTILVDISGEIFGQLTIVRPHENYQASGYKWLCRCTCGTELWASRSNIQSGSTWRCRECARKAVREARNTPEAIAARVRLHAKKLEQKRAWMEKNKESVRFSRRKWVNKNKKRVKLSQKQRWEKIKSDFDNIKSRAGCLFCGESNSFCLDFHHKNKADKVSEVSAMIRDKASVELIKHEIEKCVVLCSNCHRKLHGNNRLVIFKTWGWEDVIVNCEKYCGKQLGLLQGKKCSYHYHIIKDETFYVASGKVLLRYGDNDNIEDSESVILVPGNSFRVRPGLRHQFEGLERSIIIEFSTEHFDSDSYRVAPGSPQQPLCL